MKTGFSAGIRNILSALLSHVSGFYHHNTSGIYNLSGGFSNFRKMILFKVSFVNNVATKAEFTHSRQPVEWKENPYSIVSLEVYANNNVQALELAQQKANALLKGKR